MAVVKTDRQAKRLQKRSKNQLIAARVIDIILDSSHPLFIESGGSDAIGTIFFNLIDDKTPLEDPKNAPRAKPLFSFIKNYPLINEIVLITSTYDKEIYNSNGLTTYYLPNINVWNHPHHNALPTTRGLDVSETLNDYALSENGSIRREVEDEGTDINLGKYFNEQLNVKPLLPYEGDTIIEGRFGNSIRFGSTNFSEKIPDNLKNPWSIQGDGETGDPITIIRNGQSKDLDEQGWIHTVEEINGDLSSIYLTSNQQMNFFKAASSNHNSYKAEEEPVDAFDPINFEGLNREGNERPRPTATPTKPPWWKKYIPAKEEPILNSPKEVIPEKPEVPPVVDTDPDYNDSNETENTNRRDLGAPVTPFIPAEIDNTYVAPPVIPPIPDGTETEGELDLNLDELMG